MSQSPVTYYCECSAPKIYRLMFAGGSSGNYFVEYCQKCYDEDDKMFMLLEEKIKEEGFDN